MKQKLGLACTLVNPPRLLLLDEPTVGVDPVSRRELWVIVYRLVRDEGMSVLLSTAYLDEAERCRNVVLIHQGRILGQGRPGDFSEELRGHTFLVRAPRLNKRLLQQRISALPDVIDAVIQGQSVRVVSKVERAPDLTPVTEAIGSVTIEPAEPRFEDSFIRRIYAAGDGVRKAAPLKAGLAPQSAPGSSKPVVIEVRGLSRRFGDFEAVRNLSFEVTRGEVFGLLGANGAGKTTTFRMLCGLLPASGGTLRVAGHDLRHAAARARARIGYMSQKFSLYADLSVHQNLDFFASAYGLTGSGHRERVAQALDDFELIPFAGDEAGNLPLGFKQRLALAAALMHAPDILFLDEPTSGVDPVARREFWHRITTLAANGVTVLVTTHFMEEVEYCDRLAIMAAGKLLTLGTPEEVKASAARPDRPEPTMEDAFIGVIEAQSGIEAGA